MKNYSGNSQREYHPRRQTTKRNARVLSLTFALLLVSLVLAMQPGDRNNPEKIPGRQEPATRRKASAASGSNTQPGTNSQDRSQTPSYRHRQIPRDRSPFRTTLQIRLEDDESDDESEQPQITFRPSDPNDASYQQVLAELLMKREQQNPEEDSDYCLSSSDWNTPGQIDYETLDTVVLQQIAEYDKKTLSPKNTVPKTRIRQNTGFPLKKSASFSGIQKWGPEGKSSTKEMGSYWAKGKSSSEADLRDKSSQTENKWGSFSTKLRQMWSSLSDFSKVTKEAPQTSETSITTKKASQRRGQVKKRPIKEKVMGDQDKYLLIQSSADKVIKSQEPTSVQTALILAPSQSTSSLQSPSPPPSPPSPPPPPPPPPPLPHSTSLHSTSIPTQSSSRSFLQSRLTLSEFTKKSIDQKSLKARLKGSGLTKQPEVSPSDLRATTMKIDKQTHKPQDQSSKNTKTDAAQP